ncbi:MAG: tetratricopeptide repeat protein, partial [Gemmatimonadales bacterium]
GRLQGLTIAWDTRAVGEGGQRWFHLYPDEEITFDDELHWTKRSQNWNRGCAECHSTDLVKGYDPKTRSYATTWSDINVGCEACHGPGSSHVESAARDEPYQPGATGLVSLRDSAGGLWRFDPGASIARRASPAADRVEVETCAPCHARRVQVADGRVPGEPLLDEYIPLALEDQLYFVDGQIRDEVYVYGSFTQSRMYHLGVSCSDCHEPHSLELRAPGNAVCATCHLPATYDTSAHYFHEPGSEGAQCVACHMPTRTYMVVDDRRDHSMRIPRPDLSGTLGTPNACTQCHQDRTDSWASRSVTRWYGPRPDPETPSFGEIIHGARQLAPDAERKLLNLAHQDTLPAIVRATVLDQLLQTPSRPAAQAVIRAIDDQHPLVRYHALGALQMLPPAQRWQLAEHRLQDTILSVRSEAGRILAGTSTEQLSPEQQALLDRAIDDYLTIQAFDADHPATHVNAGLVETARGRPESAEAAYREAISVDVEWLPAYVNLADLFRAQGRDGEAVEVLRQALGEVDEAPAIRHALGLLLVRTGRMEEALVELQFAAEAAPNQVRFGYVYGVALSGADRTDEAVAVFEEGLRIHPRDRELLFALAVLYRDLGDVRNGRRIALRLKSVEPMRERAADLLAEFEVMERGGPR